MAIAKQLHAGWRPMGRFEKLVFIQKKERVCNTRSETFQILLS